MKLITADGRDITHEEWRVIPEFPKYMITQDGDVKNRRTGHLLVETEGSRGAYYYNLWKTEKGKDKAYHRGFWSLVCAAFPELKPTPTWTPIADVPGYKINKKGEVKNAKYEKVATRKDGDVEYVMLRTDEGMVRKTISDLMAVAYPEVKEEKVA